MKRPAIFFQADGQQSRDFGIAVGPILFIIAILAILAAVITASSGSFTATGSESNRTKSTTLVQIGDNLKMGMEKLTIQTGISVNSIDINVSNTTLNNQLFAPAGGGIAPPSPGMAANPVYDRWYFPRGKPDGFGGGAANSIFAVLPVARGVCSEINNRSVGVSAVPPAAALGDFTAETITTGADWPLAGNTWTTHATATATNGPTLEGVLMGCVYNSDIASLVATNCSSVNTEGTGTGCSAGPTSPFFFYQVLAIQ